MPAVIISPKLQRLMKGELFDQIGKQVFRDASLSLEAEAKENVPVVTANLQRSINTVIVSPLIGEVVADAVYARRVEEAPFSHGQGKARFMRRAADTVRGRLSDIVQKALRKWL